MIELVESYSTLSKDIDHSITLEIHNRAQVLNSSKRTLQSELVKYCLDIIEICEEFLKSSQSNNPKYDLSIIKPISIFAHADNCKLHKLKTKLDSLKQETTEASPASLD